MNNDSMIKPVTFGIIGPLQLRIMNIIWERGASTVREVYTLLNKQPGAPKLAYTTILTVMRNLARRGILHQAPVGRCHVFSPNVTADDYKHQLLQCICFDFFNDDPEALMKAARKLDK